MSRSTIRGVGAGSRDAVKVRTAEPAVIGLIDSHPPWPVSNKLALFELARHWGCVAGPSSQEGAATHPLVNGVVARRKPIIARPATVAIPLHQPRVHGASITRPAEATAHKAPRPLPSLGRSWR